MKKWTAVLLAALFVIAAAGCSGSDDTPLPGVYNADGETVRPTASPMLPGADLYDGYAGTWTAQDGDFIDVCILDGAVCIQFGNWDATQVTTGKVAKIPAGTVSQRIYTLLLEENGETVTRTYLLEARSRTQIAFGEQVISAEGTPATDLKEYTYDAARQRTTA
ncbi:MAG: hypothetical protein IKI50_06185 [Clostridia bacterium]|nr:hypothetical protein [Clostridia bacterium]